ncbi:MAG: hypothetical protein K6E28_09020 [Eubacterium sp.]|nr:hypothetical protein [Eubacterium sp.]
MEMNVIDFEEFVNMFNQTAVDYNDIDLEFEDYDYEIQNLSSFNDAISDGALDNVALWIENDEFGILYNYLRRYNNTYKNLACEMRFTVTVDDRYIDREELILSNFGIVLCNSLRKSDVITQHGNDFYILLPGLTEENKVSVLSRIRKNLQKENLYQFIEMSVDTMVIGPDAEYETWYRVAV